MKRAGSCVAALLALGAVAGARDARADEFGDAVAKVGGGIAGVGLQAVDEYLALRDVFATSRRLPDAAGTFEIAFAAPQVALSGAIMAYPLGPDDEPATRTELRMMMVSFATLPLGVAMHGAWVLGQSDEHAWRWAAAPVLAADAALGVYDAVRGLNGELPSFAYGVFEMTATVPQIAIAIAGAGEATTTGDRVAGYVLATVPAALFGHGLLTAIERFTPPKKSALVARSEPTLVLAPAMLPGWAGAATGVAASGTF